MISCELCFSLFYFSLPQYTCQMNRVPVIVPLSLPYVFYVFEQREHDYKI